MTEIKQEELKEFWEWCGLKPPHPNCQEVGHMSIPMGKSYYCGEVAFDLNNLFKYAEKPLVDHFIETTHTEEEYRQAYYDFLCKWLVDYIWNEPHNPALALYQAIQRVRGREE